MNMTDSRLSNTVFSKFKIIKQVIIDIDHGLLCLLLLLILAATATAAVTLGV